MASIVATCISLKKGEVKKEVDKLNLIENLGAENDAHRGEWHRQISLLAKESVDTMRDKLSIELVPGIFAENILTEGIELHTLPVGTRLEIGGAILEVTQIGKECHNGCEIRKLAGDCIMPKRGIFARVIKGAVIKKGDEIKVLNPLTAAVVTISDKCSKKERVDTSGPAVRDILKENGFDVIETSIIPDESEEIKDKLMYLTDVEKPFLILTTGGTGFAPRDITPEATKAVIVKEAPGLAELMRAESLKKTPYASLSRAIAGIRGKTLIVNLPGSEKGARENLMAILPVLEHAHRMLRGNTEH